MALTIAALREAFRSLFKLAAIACLILFAAQALPSRQPQENPQTKYIIERLNLVGNRSIRIETILARISSRPGVPYSVEAVRRDVRALWDTQFFDDVRLNVEDSPDRPDGKIVVFSVVERPIMGRIEYKGITAITESNILHAFKHEKVELTVGNRFDQTKMTRAAAVIRELLAVHRHPSATVKPTYERIPSSNTVTLVFNIEEGPKTQGSKNHP